MGATYWGDSRLTLRHAAGMPVVCMCCWSLYIPSRIRKGNVLLEIEGGRGPAYASPRTRRTMRLYRHPCTCAGSRCPMTRTHPRLGAIDSNFSLARTVPSTPLLIPIVHSSIRTSCPLSSHLQLHLLQHTYLSFIATNLACARLTGLAQCTFL